MTRIRSAAAAFAIAALPLFAFASKLPAEIAPGAPFPHVLTDAATVSFVAPGIALGDYRLETSDGPIVVKVVSVDLRDPLVRVDAALAQERVVSTGETVSSMATRTGAVAGVNGDYFDIDNTNAPLNILVESGHLVHSPMRRYALSIHQDRRATFDEFGFGGTLQLANGAVVQLDGVNAWGPPKGGTTILTPAFGPVAAQENVTLVRLAPVFGTPPFATYRVTGIADNTARQEAGYYLGIGINAYGSAGVPNAGDTIVATGALTPPLTGVVAAIGGGPLLLKGGIPFDDPDGPGGGEFLTRIPSTGAAVTADGRLLLLEVDGRQPDLSIGVTRAQFAALMLAFGARDGMALDGGGSSTIVARRLGERAATLQNSPSDGTERRVGDGIFAYSEAPVGPPARLAALPQAVRAVAGATVAVRLTVADEAGHYLRDAGTATVRADRPGFRTVQISREGLVASVPLEVVTSPRRLEILPRTPNVRAGSTIALAARAYDARGFELALPPKLDWRAGGGRIDAAGNFVATDRDGTVALTIGTSRAETRVSVGDHLTPELPVAENAIFRTVPANGPGSLDTNRPCVRCVSLAYDFTSGERAAYVQTDLRLPDDALGLTLDVLGDGQGETLRVALVNAINERVAITAGKIDFTGWRQMHVAFPKSLAQPARLRDIYVIDALAGEPVRAAGSIAIRDVRARVAGSAH